jgi:hypothetical protein
VFSWAAKPKSGFIKLLPTSPCCTLMETIVTTRCMIIMSGCSTHNAASLPIAAMLSPRLFACDTCRAGDDVGYHMMMLLRLLDYVPGMSWRLFLCCISPCIAFQLIKYLHIESCTFLLQHACSMRAAVQVRNFLIGQQGR